MNVFDLFATLKLNDKEYREGLKDAEKEGKKAGESAEKSEGKFKKLATAIGSGIKKAAAVGSAAITAASGVVVALTKSAVESYAETEQLIGGVETLFKSSADEVERYAAKAYQTAGISANQYREIATGAAAAMVASLEGDVKKAAELTDMAVIDMADNSAKMGTNLESIQTAYAGFAKQNYTLLDNLKLGYGGTKAEMERLLKDAEKLSGQKFDLSSYADIVQAIHVVQENMGIAGTTAKEAAETISGSLQMTKASWENLVSGLADPNADIGALVKDLTDSAGIALDNLIPVATKALDGISNAIVEIVPKITEELPKILEKIVPNVVSAAVKLVNTLAQSLPQIITPIVDAIPELLGGASEFIQAIIKVLPSIIEVIADKLPELIPELIDAVVNLITILMENIDEIVVPIIKALPSILSAVGKGLADNAPFLLTGGVDVLLKNVFGGIGDLIAPAFNEAKKDFSKFESETKMDMQKVWEGFKAPFEKAGAFFNEKVFEPIANFFAEKVEKIKEVYNKVIAPWIEIAKRAYALLKEKVLDPIFEKVSEALNSVKEEIERVFGIVRDWFTEHISDPVKNWVSSAVDKVKEKAGEAWEGIKSVFSPIAEWFHDKFSKAWQKVKDVFSTGGKIFEGIKEGITSAFVTVVNTIIAGLNKVIKIPFEKINELLSKIHDVEILGVSPFEWVKQIEVPEFSQIKMANGGIINRATNILAGEAGAEAIVPLENSKYTRSLAREISANMNGAEMTYYLRQIADILDGGITLDSDNRELGRFIRKYATT